jgi:acetylornithine deacetylase/succinyl-diaminopimelate desuccinylase-like protein
MPTRFHAIALVLAVFAACAARADAPDFDAAARSTRELLAQLVAADTSNPPGNEARAVAIGVQKLQAAGIPYRVTEFAPGRENLVARLEGDGSAEPLLLRAHIDVVGAGGQEWTVEPHRLTERDGYLYGRGVLDDLAMAAIELEVLLLLAESGLPLARDVIVAWTGDEESGGSGIEWLLENAPESIEAEVVLNEGGGIRLGDDGEPLRVDLQTAEKIYQDYALRARGPTGHSSVPLPDNAIYRLSGALNRIAKHSFPVRILPVTQASLAGRAPTASREEAEAMRAVVASPAAPPAAAIATLDRDPALAASLRTTCVATMIEGGTRENALPAEARAIVNCRILPDETAAAVHAALVRVVDDPEIEISMPSEFGSGRPSPLDGPGPSAIAAVVEQMAPGIPIVPFMSRGATDSRFLRAKGMAAYGLGPIAVSEADGRRIHGVDERIPAGGLRPGVEFLYRLVVELAGRP